MDSETESAQDRVDKHRLYECFQRSWAYRSVAKNIRHPSVKQCAETFAKNVDRTIFVSRHSMLATGIALAYGGAFRLKGTPQSYIADDALTAHGGSTRDDSVLAGMIFFAR